MKLLTSKEINKFLDDSDKADQSIAGIKTTIGELINLNAGINCNDHGCFNALPNKFFNRKVIGWFSKRDNEMVGMIHIECNGNEAKTVERIVGIRNDSCSLLNGFWEFEDE